MNTVKKAAITKEDMIYVISVLRAISERDAELLADIKVRAEADRLASLLETQLR